MYAATVEQLAQSVEGTVRGDGAREIRDVAALTKAGPDEITFAAGEKHLRKLHGSRAGACLVARKEAAALEPGADAPALVLVDDPLDAVIVLLELFRPSPARTGIGIHSGAWISPAANIGPGCNVHPGVTIDDGACVGARCDIYPGVYIGRNCRIGDDCVLYPHVVLYADVTLESRVVLHAGAVLGADGFGYRFRNQQFEKIPQRGSVRIESDCEIGAGATIDRGMIGATIVGAGTKIDNLVMIGHNCELGRHNVFASQVGLAGSVTTGDYVRLAGQVGVADHVHMGQGCTLGAKSGVHKDIPAGETHVGYPARPDQEELRIVMATTKLPEMRKVVRGLETRVAELERQLEHLAAAG